MFSVSRYTFFWTPLDRPKGRMLSTLGARSFYAAAPTLWNSLPANIREITSLSIFKKKT